MIVKKIYRNILLLLLAMESAITFAQPVAKTVLVEHFTNSYCSICASRNPGFFQNLAQFPSVLHIAYYPSSPYPQCPINQYNKPEADARTKYYGVFGGTPRLVIQGAAISAGTDFNSSTIFTSAMGATTPFAAGVLLTKLNSATAEVRFVVKKMDTSPLDSVSLYVAIVEDTLIFNAVNGEQKHYDVFRRSAWGVQPLRMKVPANIGDSIVAITTVAIDAQWPQNRMYGIGIVQELNGSLQQAARSNKLSGTSTFVPNLEANAISVYPNPARDIVHIEHAAGGVVTIYNLIGNKVSEQTIGSVSTVPLGGLPSGHYVFRVVLGATTRQFLITKQ